LSVGIYSQQEKNQQQAILPRRNAATETRRHG
jgi:hypothetical protein